MKTIIRLIAVLSIFSGSMAGAVVYTGAMDNRAGFPFVPGFTGHSRAWVTGGDEEGGVRLEWQADNETTPGSWTYTYRMVRNIAKKKGFGFFDIETAADFTALNIKARQVLSATDGSSLPIASGLGSITISDPANFNQVHDFTNAAVTEVTSLTVLDKFDLSHYSGDPGRVAPGVAGGNSSALPSAGPQPHPFSGIRVTFPGSFADLANLGYEASEWSFRVVTDRVPMWGRFFGWGDQTTLSPFWYSDVYNNHIDDPGRLLLPPIDGSTGADPYQGWILVPGPLPSVISTNPEDASPAVPITEPLTAVFSGIMDPATINAVTFTLANGALPVPGAVFYDADANTATFIPAAPLIANTTYTATVTSGATDLAGNPLSPAKVWSFTTTAQDIVPPAVTATFPGTDATYLAISTPFAATFSEEIDPLTLAANFTVASGGVTVTGTVSYLPTIRTAIFTPVAPLANNTTYTATIAAGVRDRAGNPLAAPETWLVTTVPVETVLPIISATVPAARAVNVKISTPIRAIFSEAMDPATINASTFTVAGLTGTVSYDAATLTATFTPDVQPLDFNTTYRATITTAVSDPAGNHLPLANVWSFTTAAPDFVPPTITGTSPVDGSTNVPVTAVISAAFSEQVDPATFSLASIAVVGQSYAAFPPFTVTGAVGLSGGGITLPSAQFTPDVPLPKGSVYTVTVTGVTDPAGNPMADKVWSFVTTPDGILIPGGGIAGALRLMRIAVGLEQPTQDDRNHGDVAPLGPDGKPRPNGVIDVGDALIVLRMIVGLVSL